MTARKDETRERIARTICRAAAGDTSPTPVPDALMPPEWDTRRDYWLLLADATMAEINACVTGTLIEHGFLPHSRTQEEPGGVTSPSPQPARLTDTSGSRENAMYTEAKKRKDTE